MPLRRCADLAAIVIDGAGAIGPNAFSNVDVSGAAVLLRTVWDRRWGTERYGGSTIGAADGYGCARLSAIGHSVAPEPEEASVTEQSAERRPIGWWLKTADARIEQAFEDVFESQSITRREWQVLEPGSRQVAHGGAAAGVTTVRSVVSAALPGQNYATLIRLLADLVNALIGHRSRSH